MSYTKRRKLERQIINQTPEVTVQAQTIQRVARMKYLGQIITADGATSEIILHQLQRAQANLVPLRKILRHPALLMKHRIRLLNTLIIPILLYASETWKWPPPRRSLEQRRIRQEKWEERLRAQAIEERDHEAFQKWQQLQVLQDKLPS